MSSDQLIWEDDAMTTLKKIPAFVRPMAKKKIEKAARARGIERITTELMQQIRTEQMGN